MNSSVSFTFHYVVRCCERKHGRCPNLKFRCLMYPY